MKYVYDSVLYYFTTGDLFSIKMLNIPWQINYRFFDGNFTPFISLGPTINLRFGYKQNDQMAVNYVTKHYNYNDGIQMLQFGYNAGAGLRFCFSEKSGVIVKYDYEKGFQYFNTWPGDRSFSKNSYFSVSFFYRLH